MALQLEEELFVFKIFPQMRQTEELVVRLLAIEEGDENQDGEDYCRYDHVDKERVGDCVELGQVHDSRDDAEP